MATKRPGAALQQAAEQGQKLWTGFEIETHLKRNLSFAIQIVEHFRGPKSDSRQ